MNNRSEEERFRHLTLDTMTYDEKRREIVSQLKKYKQLFTSSQIDLINHRIYELKRAIHFSRTKTEEDINQAKLDKLIIDAQIAFNHLKQIIKEPTS